MTAFSLPDATRTISYRSPQKGGLFIDATTAGMGYVTSGYIGSGSAYNRLKFQVRNGERVYNYDLPLTPTQFPVNMGNGVYRFRVMENVEGNQYVEVMCVRRIVKLKNAFAPYLVPNVYCDYKVPGPCVTRARALCAKCNTELEALDVVGKWVAGHVSYDYEKAKRLSKSTGYVPDPQQTLKERKGICFDYASLTAAMLRAVDIPCRVVTGYVDDGFYHAWVSAYVNGRWRRRDPTMMAVGQGFSEYKNRYVY